VDPYRSSIDFTRAMMQMQPEMLAAEQQFRPQYLDLELADINRLMQGTEGQAGLLGLEQLATQQASQSMIDSLRAQREADISDVEALGGRASAAFMQANPQLMAALEKAEALRGSTEAGEGEQQIGALGLDFLNRGGNLTPLQARNAEQQARMAGVARGREMGQGSIYEEMQNRMAQEMQLEQQNVAMGLGLIGQQFGMEQQRMGQNRGYALDMLGANQRVGSDPFQAILGRPSTAPGMGQASTQYAGSMASQPMGPNLFDPNAGINLALQQNQNMANYQSSIFGSQAALAGAQAQAKGAMMGGLFQGLGAIAAAPMTGGTSLAGKFLGCWVAREVYGEDNSDWMRFREWLLTKAPRWFRALYIKYGERFAAFIKDKPKLKRLIKKWMDGRIN
jgi:hypothetical protein